MSEFDVEKEAELFLLKCQPITANRLIMLTKLLTRCRDATEEAAIIAACQWCAEDQRRALIPSELIHERRRQREEQG